VKIFISSDHAGFEVRKTVVSLLRTRRIDVEDLGPETAEPRDYPDEAVRVARRVQGEPQSRGILVCGSGVGMCIAANKVAGIRAVDAWNDEVARLSRAHNDTNVLCLGARVLSAAEAESVLNVWLATPFDGGRHAGRVAKISEIESKAGSL